MIGGDDIAGGRRRAADLIIGCVVDPDAVARVAGLALAEDIPAAGGRADVVALDEIARGPDALDADAGAGVVGDEVARGRGRPADAVARRLDQDPFAPLPARKYGPLDPGPIRPIWLPSTWLPEAPGSIRMPCMPLPPMTLLS